MGWEKKKKKKKKRKREIERELKFTLYVTQVEAPACSLRSPKQRRSVRETWKMIVPFKSMVKQRLMRSHFYLHFVSYFQSKYVKIVHFKEVHSKEVNLKNKINNKPKQNRKLKPLQPATSLHRHISVF